MRAPISLGLMPAFGTAQGRPRSIRWLAYARQSMDPIARWLRACPPQLRDVLLALTVTAVAVGGSASQPAVRGYQDVDAIALALAAVGGLSLAGRRRYPNAVFAVTLLAAVVFAARGYPAGPGLLTVLVSIYSAALVVSRRRSLAFGVTTGIALSVTRLIFTNQTIASTAQNALGWIGAALFLGWAVANRRAFVAEIRDRADRAERTREEEARRQVDAERLRIARELHDIVAHSMSTINVQAGVGAHMIDRQPEHARQALETIKGLSKDALGELRAILDLLRAVDDQDPRKPTAGLAQLKGLLAVTEQAGVPVELHVTGQRAHLPVTVDLAAYRIIQEALTNTLRHAGSATARVALTYESETLVVDVTDDGPGLAGNEAFHDGAGHGLLGMRERAESLGGTLKVGPRSQGGFRVTATLPVTPGTA
jgi:signal transduction histidine kinase